MRLHIVRACLSECDRNGRIRAIAAAGVVAVDGLASDGVHRVVVKVGAVRSIGDGI